MMKKIHQFIILFAFTLFTLSCNKDSVVDPSTTNKQIPVDSLYFSCKIDGARIVLQSPHSTFYSWSGSTQRLYKVKNSPKDSTIVGFVEEFHNDSLFIKIGFSRTVLADTTISFPNTGENFKDRIYKLGIIPLQYLPPISDIKSLPEENQGFYITILDYEHNIQYTSYKNFNPDRSASSYNEFKKGTSCVINESNPLENKIYTNVRFINVDFACKLYQLTTNSSKIITITEGKIIGVF
ncbi:MAG: hypothetical protein ACOYOT_11010 [Bacteroidales bacterium]